MKAMNKDNPKYNDCIERELQLYERKGDFRTPFMRDYNRIIFTTAYRRLKHKTHRSSLHLIMIIYVHVQSM